MATQKRTINGSGYKPAGFDPRLVLGPADQVTATASSLARIADEVWSGSEEQVKALDTALDELGGIAATLAETATQAEAIASSTEQIVAGTQEMAASLEGVAANNASVAGSISSSATAMQQNSASIQSIRSSVADMALKHFSYTF